ncbi:MAG: penicillin-binding protein 1B [Oceanospirillaceae bacterium]|nr:penicillin-binding protein 1B [Oceanospirillaceae bacterium]MCP5350233.1 penicillin-binding protein 1B [Oceanospirillaceae bacterium]
MKKSAPRKQHKPRRWLGVLLKLMLAGAVALACLMVYLDAQVREKFEGKRWALPAKVYARPLELYAGLGLNPDDLRQELLQVGYREVPVVNEVGQFARNGDEFMIGRRYVQLWDGAENAARIEVAFEGNTVEDVAINGNPVELARLEPLLIGGIYTAHNEDRDLIQLKEVPPLLAQTLVAVEDRDFYHHFGISIKGISRAMLANIKAGAWVQGGSTLTQQLVKNFYLNQERTLYRKTTEVLMAILLDMHYDKNEILETYLNEVFLGQSGRRAIHGFGLAAQFYFGKHISKLEPHEIALIVGMVKGPSYYNPRRFAERALNRRNTVLMVMHEQGLLSDAQYKHYRYKTLGVTQASDYKNVEYPAFLQLVQRQLREDYNESDLTSEGLKIYTSLDPIVQRHAEIAMQNRLDQTEREYRIARDALEGAMVVAATETGEVEALIGARNPRFFGFNRALDANRPVGSLAKPAVYLAALRSQQYTLITPLDDAPVTVAGRSGTKWQPENYDKQNHGILPLYQAMATSLNQATARLGMTVGLDKVVQTFSDLGVQQELPKYPSILLGSFSLSPFEVAEMYQTLAASGFHTPLKAIRGVTTADGELLSRYGYQVEQSIDSDSAYLIQFAMQKVVSEGTGQYLLQRMPAELNLAGKTGTSDSQRDSWFAGFSGDKLAVTWVGRDDNKPMPLTGASGALRVWADTMAGLPLKPLLPLPGEGISQQWVLPLSQQLTDADCEGAQLIPFIKGSEPTEQISCHAAATEEHSGSWWQSIFGD